MAKPILKDVLEAVAELRREVEAIRKTVATKKDLARIEATLAALDGYVRDDQLPDEAESHGEADPLYADAVRAVLQTRRCSTSWLQRKLAVSHERAVQMLQAMQRRRVVGPANASGEHEILTIKPN